MKKLFTIIGAVLAIAAYSHAQNYTVSVGTSSTVVIPDTKVDDGDVWTNGMTVANGDYVVVTGSVDYVYFALTGGTASEAPSHKYGVVAGADTIEWLYLCRRHYEQKRSNAIIFADDAAVVHYTHDGQDATTDASPLDYDAIPARSFPGEQTEVKCISESGTADIYVELKRGNY